MRETQFDDCSVEGPIVSNHLVAHAAHELIIHENQASPISPLDQMMPDPIYDVNNNGIEANFVFSPNALVGLTPLVRANDSKSFSPEVNMEMIEAVEGNSNTERWNHVSDTKDSEDLSLVNSIYSDSDERDIQLLLDDGDDDIAGIDVNEALQLGKKLNFFVESDEKMKELLIGLKLGIESKDESAQRRSKVRRLVEEGSQSILDEF